MKKVTIYDVAKEAGVSPATVSRVINQKGYIAPQTLRHVEQTMRKLGYVRAPGAAAFSESGTSRAIGVMVPDIRYEHCTNIVYHIEDVLSQAGYSCILCNANNSCEKALKDLAVLTRRKVEGLILVNSFFSSKPIVEWLRRASLNIPIVSALCRLDLPNAYNILLDMDESSKRIFGCLAEKGKNRIILIQSKSDMGSIWMKHSMARTAKTLFAVPPAVVSLSGVTMDSGYQAAKQVMDQYPDANALVFDCTLPAIGACRFLLDAGMQIPEQVSVFAAEMLSVSNMVHPKLACVDNHQDVIGKESARTMLDLIAGLGRPHIVRLSVDILSRETL